MTVFRFYARSAAALIFLLASCSGDEQSADRTVSKGGKSSQTKGGDDSDGGEEKADKPANVTGAFLVDCAWGRPVSTNKAEVACGAAKKKNGDSGGEAGLALLNADSWDMINDAGDTVQIKKRAIDADGGHLAVFEVPVKKALQGGMMFKLEGESGLQQMTSGLCGLGQDEVHSCVDGGDGTDCVSDYLVMQDGDCESIDYTGNLAESIERIGDITGINKEGVVTSIESSRPLTECLNFDKDAASSMMGTMQEMDADQDSLEVSRFLERHMGMPNCE